MNFIIIIIWAFLFAQCCFHLDEAQEAGKASFFQSGKYLYYCKTKYAAVPVSKAALHIPSNLTWKAQ